MSITIVPALTYDELLRRATEIRAERADMAFHANLTDAEALSIAARAITYAIDMWCDEFDEPHTVVLDAMKATALVRIIQLGWDEFYDEQQLDLFLDDPITRGAAAHEARGELG